MSYDPHQPSYPSKYDSAFEAQHYPPPSSYPPSSQYQDAPHQQSRPSSKAPFDGLPQPTQQPLRNALNNAFDKSDAARMVDSDLIAQITEEVKKSVLNEIKMSAAGADIGAQTQPAPTSPSASFPSRNVYTPPSPRYSSPRRPSPPSRSSSAGSYSPDPLARDPLSREPIFDGTDDTPTPRHERNAHVETCSESVPRSRPPPAQRLSTDGDFTPIEKMWQRLFDSHDQPTPRLGQFLRGLALHIIDDYEPKKSLVIAPSKMLKFYEEVKLADELFPWHTIFGTLPYSTLSKVYRDMRCQHHLIQEHPADQPHVPALTPDGFQEWMTAMIQAYPTSEYDRLSKAVLDMPISNADDSKERFPKELPRRLFPRQENLQAQQRCAAALSAGGVPPRRSPSFPPPPPKAPSAAVPPLARERTPYTTHAKRRDSRVIESEDEEHEPLSIPLERERKPYAAAPGGGKVYDDLNRSVHSDTSMPEQRKRTQSTAVPPPPSLQQHPRANSTTTGRRPRSPSFSSYGTRSDGSVRDIPGSYYSSNIYDSEEENRRFAKDAELKRNDWARRQAEEDVGTHSRRSTAGLSDSSYDSQPRSVYEDRNLTNGYDNRGYEPRRY